MNEHDDSKIIDRTHEKQLAMDDHRALIATRLAKLPDVDAPTPATTCLLLPMMDGRIEFETAKSIMAGVGTQWTGLIDKCGTSHVGLVRNELTAAFLRTPFEWAVMIDNDIIFSPQDMAFLLDGNNYAVNAPYAQKDDEAKAVTRGLGFARVHRCVFELIQDEKICTPFVFQGQPMTDFFIQGATGSGGWLGEDSGFWWILSQVGVIPRLEGRCTLQHMGKYRYAIR